jgi:hypothetical protein
VQFTGVRFTSSKWPVIQVHFVHGMLHTVNAGVLHDTMKRISAMELHDVPTLAFDELVNEVECLFGGRRRSREVVGQDADQLPSATLRQASSLYALYFNKYIIHTTRIP